MTETKYQTQEELAMTPEELLEHKLKGLKAKVEETEASEARALVERTDPLADLDGWIRMVAQQDRIKTGLRKLAERWKDETIIYQADDLKEDRF